MTVNEVKVSVIIPIYNVEKYLRECLESVVRQSLREIEIICVDDCSTDGSRQVAEEFKALDSRVTLLAHEKNQGLSVTRNTGLAAAKGEYIYFLDSDDYICENTLEHIYHTAKKDELDLVIFDSKTIFENEELEAQMESDRLFMAKYSYPEILGGREFLKQIRENRDIREPVWLQLVSRELLVDNQITFYEGILHEDILYLFLVLMHAKRVRCINEQYHYYRKRENAITTVKTNEKNLISLAKNYVEIFTFWKENQIEPVYGEAIEHYLDRISWRVNRILDENDDRKKVEELLKEDRVTWHMFKLILEDPKPQSPRYRNKK